MTEPLSPTSLVLPLPVEAWVERRDTEYLIGWTPDEPLLALYGGPDPDHINFTTPLPAMIDAVGKLAVVRSRDEERAEALDYERLGSAERAEALDYERGAGRAAFTLDFGHRRLTVAERTLTLSGGVNFRDVGGYGTADGRAVRWGQVYRAGSLAELADADVAALGALGLRLVCDLRSPDELTRQADRLPPGARHTHRPILGEVGRLRRVVTLYRHRHRLQALLEQIYRLMLDQNGPVIAGVLHLAADPANRPLVIHCTAGKDRTGLTVALLLLALGVPEETVVADYTLSNHAFDVLAGRMRPEMARLYAFGFNEAQLQPLLLAEARTLRGALAYLGRRYGSLDWYLQRAGLSADTLDALRDGLLIGQ